MVPLYHPHGAVPTNNCHGDTTSIHINSHLCINGTMLPCRIQTVFKPTVLAIARTTIVLAITRTTSMEQSLAPSTWDSPLTGVPSGMPGWNGLPTRQKTSFLSTDCGCLQSSCVVFTLIKSNPKPMIDFTAIAQEGMMLLF